MTPGPRAPLRVLAYTDQRYWRRDGAVWAQRSFVQFLGGLGEQVQALTVLGRLADGLGADEGHYRLPAEAAFVALPWYASAADPPALARALAGSLRRFNRALDDADVCWLLGPSPFALAFAALALARRRRVVLGVRQDLPAYARSRHPGRRLHAAAADIQEALFRLLARRVPVVTVGPDLARGYRRAAALLALPISLVRERDVIAGPQARTPSFEDRELRVVSVSRLDTEKNPLLLADVLARLVAADPRWRLVVAGEGPMEGELRERLVRLGVAERAELLGHVDLDPGLHELYRAGHVFLHVSWTEGLPQVLFEAFAAGLPVVATDVGGVADATAGAALLVGAGDADAAADAVLRVAAEPALRAELTERAIERARATTIEGTTQRRAAFLGGP